ncbi:10579_t:CDS:2 [Ambispora leptoticha]|uniref:10579_t:CDS:1 n=1 Tax=Ambispora leptoticha TaxID=144679 RepID=A0A9N9ASV5_9GLOM|nr:10579_t:CDS:2 [Ambispora leptoticha]
MNILNGLFKYLVYPIQSTYNNNGNARKTKTFKGKKPLAEDTKQYQLQKYAEATLSSGDLKLAVVLPEGEDINEWLAVNTYDFFNQINMLYSTITEFCTPQQCPIMSAGASLEYLWSDDVNVKKPIKLSAPEYVDHLMTWIQEQMNDENIFPSTLGNPFPKNFREIVKKIFKRLFRVYAHIYLSHMTAITALEEGPHLNTSLKHFVYFVQEFDLIEQPEMKPLTSVIEALMKSPSSSTLEI